MLLDTMRFKNASGDEINLMSSTIRSNPREAKLWSYSVADSVNSNMPKPFTLTIICSSDSNHKGEYYANEVVTKLSKDAAYNKCGFLEINNWRLDCYFIGVSGIETDLYGVVKFTANFYAPNGFLWYKITASRVTIPSSAEWIGQPQIASITSENVVATKIILKSFNNTGSATTATTAEKVTDNIAGYGTNSYNNQFMPGTDWNKYYCIDSFRRKITIASSTSTNVSSADGDYKINSEKDATSRVSMNAASWIFMLFPWGKNPKISLQNRSFAYESYGYVTFYELRGMPEWTIT